jgi:hypothetical protein
MAQYGTGRPLAMLDTTCAELVTFWHIVEPTSTSRRTPFSPWAMVSGVRRTFLFSEPLSTDELGC